MGPIFQAKTIRAAMCALSASVAAEPRVGPAADEAKIASYDRRLASTAAREAFGALDGRGAPKSSQPTLRDIEKHATTECGQGKPMTPAARWKLGIPVASSAIVTRPSAVALIEGLSAPAAEFGLLGGLHRISFGDDQVRWLANSGWEKHRAEIGRLSAACPFFR